MDKSKSANTTQGATGQNNPTGDFEVHPVGTAERLRRLGIIGPQAAEFLEEEAKALFACHSFAGEWDPNDKSDAREVHGVWLATAHFLRVLCTPPAAAPALDPMQDVPTFVDDDMPVIYPFPAGED